MRIDKYLSGAGCGSRREVKLLLRSGAVTVKGQVCRDASFQVEEDDSVAVDGTEVVYREFIYLMLHKPAGYVSATEDRRLATVLDLVPEEYLHFEPFPVGRLDRDTEGLLLMTNDGAMAHRLLSPRSHVPKRYYAKLERPVTEEDIAAFAAGITLEDGTLCLPAKLEPQGEDGIVTIVEGKFHQVKRMMEAVGNRVLYLKRLSMGGLCLDETLEPGDIRELTKEETEAIWIF